ncbi:MAG: hypothetical protein K8U57_19075 [Planctomycetes bacterium]|nr:hypothetical protein [Planctomycetota bacterium]
MSDSAICITRPATAAIQHAFVAIMPRVVRHARITFRQLACADSRENAIAETVALAWKWFARLVQQGRHPEEFVSVIAAYAARAVKSGRRLCGQEKAKDVLSPLAQTRQGFLVSPFPKVSTLAANPFDEALQDNTQTPVPDQVSFRLDFPAWLSTRTERDRAIIGELMVGERTLDVSRKCQVSAARISQFRREYLPWRLIAAPATGPISRRPQLRHSFNLQPARQSHTEADSRAVCRSLLNFKVSV